MVKMALENKLQGLFKNLYKSVLASALAASVIGCAQKLNNNPIITSNPQVGEVYEGATFQYDVEAKNSDSLTYSLVTAPAGATIDSATGLIKWIPGYKGKGDNYEVNFTVKVQDDNSKSAEQNFTLNVKGVNLGDYFYFPGRNLYIAKQQSLRGLNWYQAHYELHKRGARMLTLREFMEFFVNAKGLRDGLGNPIPKEKLESLPSSWTSEWLDAYFEPIDGNLYIKYNHRIINGNLKPLNSEPLEECLMEDCDIDINLRDLTKQGMPTEKENDLRYFRPSRDKRSVAGFGIYDDGRIFALGCNYDPMMSQVGAGARKWAGENSVREAREKR